MINPRVVLQDEYQRMKIADEVTVYKQVGRRSFDVSSLANSNSVSNLDHHISSGGADSGRRSSAHLMAPSSSGKDGPQRRISMTAMDEKKHRKPSPAIDINHRKSNSMDNSVVTSAIVAAYRFSPLHGSVDGIVHGQTAKVIAGEMTKSASEDDPAMTNASIPELLAETDGGNEQDGMMRRLRANSVEMLKRLSPRLRTPSSGDRSPSPCGRPPSRGAASSVFAFRNNASTIAESTSSSTLTPFHSATSMLNSNFSTPPATPLPKLVDDTGRRLSGSHSPLLNQRSASPFRKPKIPSPIFFKSDKQGHCASPGPTMAIDTAGGGGGGGGSRCGSPAPSVFFRGSANNSIEEHEDEPAGTSSACTTPNPTPSSNGHHPTNNRRLERRYHTADGIEELKPRRAPQAGILKRFSWSTPAAAAAAAAAASAAGGPSNATKADVGLRKASATTISSESFGSSSGVSSSSSQLYVSQSETELPLGEPSPIDGGPKTTPSVGGRRYLKWSAAPRAIHQQTTETTDHSANGSPVGSTNPHHQHRNVSTIVIGEASAPLEAGEEETVSSDTSSPQTPSSGLAVSAKDHMRRKMIPIIETQAPTPLATPVSTHPAQGHTFTGAAVPPSKPPGISKEDFLKLLLQGNLESS